MPKKNFEYRKSIGVAFFDLLLYYREYFTFAYAIGNALILMQYTPELLIEWPEFYFGPFTPQPLSLLNHDRVNFEKTNLIL